MPGAKPGDATNTEDRSCTYEGSVLVDSSPPQPHGEGRMDWDNGVHYIGEWNNGKFHGHGKKIYTNGGGYDGSWFKGLRQGKGSALYGGKWGHDRWEGNFVDDKEEGEGVMYFMDGTQVPHVYEKGELAGEPPCNFEYEKSVFFRRLNRGTEDETIQNLLEQFGPLDYCYIARDKDGNSTRIGRAKFKSVGASSDEELERNEWILIARQRAVDNAKAAVEGLDKMEVEGTEIRVGLARKADMKEYLRYGDY